eukprot:gene215-284_t
MITLIKERIIVGIDPGTTVMGYGIIKVMPQQIIVLQYGVLHLQRYHSHPLKLQKIYSTITEILDEFMPDEAALEAPFYDKNPQSMLKLGRAQGVAMAAALMRELPIAEYPPATIKKAITGNGRASKEQVAHMLLHLLKFTHLPDKLDATDALAVAVCHAYQQDRQSASTSWEKFIQKNPTRLV